MSISLLTQSLFIFISIFYIYSIPFNGFNIYWNQDSQYLIVQNGKYLYNNNQSISDYDAIMALNLYNNNTIELAYAVSIDSSNIIWSAQFPNPNGIINSKSMIDLPILFHCNNITGYASANIQFDIQGYDTIKIPIFKNCIAGGIQTKLQISKATPNYEKIVLNGVTINQFQTNTPLSDLPIFPYSDSDFFTIYVTTGSQYINLNADDDSQSNAYISSGSYLTIDNSLNYFEVSYRFISNPTTTKSLVTVNIYPGSFGTISFAYYKTLKPSHSNYGLSTGAIVILFIFIFFIFVNLWGAAYKYVYLNARGWDMVLFIDDYRLIFNKCSGGVSEYKPIDNHLNKPLNHLSENEPAPHIVAQSNPFASYQKL